MQPESYAEFIDSTDRIAPLRSTIEPPLWQERYPDAILLPVEWIKLFANPEETAKAIRNKERLNEIAAQISVSGLHTPVILRIDQEGKCAIKDGHHRLVIFEMNGWDHIPTLVKFVDDIKGKGVKITSHPVTLLNWLRAG